MCPTVRVVLREANLNYDKIYDYAVPTSFDTEVVKGRRVLVPFGAGNRTREAFCLSDPFEDPPEKRDRKLKPLSAVLDEGPMLREDQLDLARQMKMRYACTYGEAIRTMLPAGTAVEVSDWIRIPAGSTADDAEEGGGPPEVLLAMLRKESEIRLTELQHRGFSRRQILDWVNRGDLERGERLHQAVKVKKVQVAVLNPESEIPPERAFEQGLINSLQQERVLDLLLEEDVRPVKDIMDTLRISRSALQTLARKGLILLEDRPVREAAPTADEPGYGSSASEGLPPDTPPVLTDEQARALATIRELPARPGTMAECLLFGVTGSGKTEIYLRLAADALSEGRQVIILVPEIALTPQTTARFAARFGSKLAVLHSRLTARERFDTWMRIRRDEADIVIGARSAIFAPLRDIGLIVIDEEHEATYVQESRPRYAAQSVARLRARHHGARLVLGSATPSVVTYARASTGRAKKLELHHRPGGSRMPDVEIVDLRQDRGEGPARGILSNRLVASMTESFGRGEQALLFLNRRGYASLYLCTSCGEQVRCPYCEVNLTWHRKRGRLICHYCGYMMPQPEACPSCGEHAMEGAGVGTEQVEAVCRRMFPGLRILRMDQDTTSGRQAHFEILDAFARKEADLLIGTQMIAKGHDWPDVTTVGIVSADQMLAINDYRASERAFQLMTQAAGRAGRSDRPGTVLLQAYDVDNYAVRAAAQHDYEMFRKEEAAFRRFLSYPPYAILGTIGLSGRREGEVRRAADDMADMLHRAFRPPEGGAEVFDPRRHRHAEMLVGRPTPAPLYRLGDRYRMQIHLRAAREAEIAEAMHRAGRHPVPRGISVSYGMDPA